MPWAVAGAAIGAAGSLAGGAMQSSAVASGSKAAARAQEEARIIAQQNLTNTLNTVGPRIESANDRSLAALRDGYGAAGQKLDGATDAATNYLNQGRATIGAGVTNANALLQPYIDQGGRALQVVGDLSGANGVDAGRAAMANFELSPGYQFALEQGLRAVDAGAAARGMLVSGGTRIAEQKFGQGLAAQDFASYYNRLAGLAGQGLSASTTAGNNLMQGAAGQSGIDRAQAQTQLTQGGAQAGLLSGLGDRVAQTEMGTAAQISNLYTGNASQQAQIGVNTAAQQAQTATSAAGAQAGIYGNMAQGFGNAVNSGLNNYMYLNQLGPQNTNYSTNTTTQAPQSQQYYQTAPVANNSGIVWG